MTREAKIGMLTGLGVIVLIGVLLSSYLGDGRAGPLAAAANRMAPVPAGESYRQQQMQPVGVPAMTAGGTKIKQANGVETLVPLDTTQSVPVAMAVDVAPSGPVVAAVVAPVPTGPTPVSRENASGPPTFEMTDKLFDASIKDPKAVGAKGVAGAGGQAAPVGATYTVAAGDNLAKIAKKFYNSSKNSDIARIVRANPGVFKDASTPLMVGKKLVISDVKPVVNPAPVAASRVDNVVVYRPGDVVAAVPTVGDANRKVERPKSEVVAPVAVSAPVAVVPAANKVYEVKAGDSLEKIARRVAASKVSETMQKIMLLNGIKNPASLQAGAKLKLPV